MSNWLTAGGIATDIAMGILGVGGQVQTNRMNRDMAREQMAFQERMSNTAATRSVADYKRAGLNPALAYDRSASSPGGATAQLGDATAAGVNSAIRAREARNNIEQLRLQRATVVSQTGLNNELARKARADADLAGQYKDTAAALQPFQQRQAQLENILSEFNLPGEHGEKWKQKIGGWGNVGLSTARDFWQWSKNFAEPAGRLTGLRREP